MAVSNLYSALSTHHSALIAQGLSFFWFSLRLQCLFHLIDPHDKDRLTALRACSKIRRANWDPAEDTA